MLSDPPSAFLVASIIWGLGDRRAIDEARLVLGRDISVVIHDDALSSLQNGRDVPVFTATRSSVRKAGRRLAEMLIDKITNPGVAQKTALLETELMVGCSCGPAPHRKR
jgi:LacI family transcriptional regulator